MKTITLSDLALMMWRFWHSDNSNVMPQEVFYEYITCNGFRFMDEVGYDSDAFMNVHRACGDVEDAFIEHVNSEGAYNSLDKFREVCALYIEEQPAVPGLDALKSLPYILATF